MKKYFIMFAAIAALMCSCTKDNEFVNPIINPIINEETTTVKFCFTPYEITPMKSIHDVGEFCTKLDVYIKDNTDPSLPIMIFHSTASGTTGGTFGNIYANVNTAHNYTIYAVAHRCPDTVTILNNVIIFPSEKMTHSMFYKNTFSPDYNTNINCEMKRIVGNIKFVIQDTVPTNAVNMRFVVDSTYTKWHLDNYPLDRASKTVVFNNFNRTNDNTAYFNLYCMTASDSVTTYINLTAIATTANDSVFDEHILYNIPVRNGYQTECKGTFFRNFNMWATFVAPDWNT